jgi:retron-type reverse transcriptase
VENLLISWQEFLRGKRKRKDVAEFQVHFMDNIIELHRELAEKTYKHGKYQAFKINDPKPRDIHKASVRDRLVHHAIYKSIYPFLDKKFIFDSYSCRLEKGTHKSINRFRYFGRRVSKNNTRTCWILKCDIRKFFANIDHEILKNILSKHIGDEDALWLILQIVGSFSSEKKYRSGLPLGNLTSQLLVNIYMNEFDQFMKRELKVRYYIRYADDFVIFSKDKNYLEKLTIEISNFLQEKLKLELHPDKVFIKTLHSGVDFLGWTHFPYCRTLRTATKKKMLRSLRKNRNEKMLVSYLGLLYHGNTYTLKKDIISSIEI